MTKSTTFYSNNARTTLSANITNSTTTLPVVSSIGFPSLTSAGDHFFITLDDGANIEIVKVTSVVGNSFQGCVRGWEGTTGFAFLSSTSVENRLTAGSITNFARINDRLANLASIDNLSDPAGTDGNSILCASTDPTGSPIVALVSGTKWKFINYPDVVKVAVVGSSPTTTSINSTGIGNVLIDSTSKMYLLQVTSGTNIGVCRFVNAITTNAFSWTTPLPNIPSVADTYEIYRNISAWKSATGTNSDRIFFENDMQVWASYSIPAGRNASSTGPVTLNTGVVVTVPAGSSWSIV